MAEVGERDNGAAGDPEELLQDMPGLAGRLNCLAQDGIVEGVIGVVDEIFIGIALNNREALGNAEVDAFPANLDAATVDRLGLGEQPQQLSVATANIDDARTLTHHLGDEPMVGANLAIVTAWRQHQTVFDSQFGAAGARPRRSAAAFKNPETVAKNSGSSKRNASWPLSDSISTKLTSAATALSAWTICLLSRVG